ncbi:MAG: glycoside hydrolase family 108 protein [Rhodobiaceae bacterium]|nr:glycoside hydrolase family 108 protein [Rhodobiaceae bacterium]MCC0055924.1 glycoside hydrolase family 108 protein [Rhodobiaceae bacterium]
MDRNFKRALPLVLKHEGGWADDPHDPGGATMRGVTIGTFRRYVKADATKADLRKITDEQIATVYYRQYWSVVQAHNLPSGLDYVVFDYAVNSGPGRAAKSLQKIVGAKVDGRVGPATIAAAEAMDTADIVNAICDERLAFLKRLKTWPRYGKGWGRRVSDVRATGLSWVGKPADVEVKVPETVEKEVKKKTGFWGWITGILGGGGAGVAGLFGMDWQAIAAIGAVAVIALIIVLLFGRQLARQVKSIREELEAA